MQLTLSMNLNRKGAKMNNSWTQNKFWSTRKGNGEYKVVFYVYKKDQRAIHAICERPSLYASQYEVDKMESWGRKATGKYRRSWEIFDDQYNHITSGIYLTDTDILRGKWRGVI